MDEIQTAQFTPQQLAIGAFLSNCWNDPSYRLNELNSSVHVYSVGMRTNEQLGSSYTFKQLCGLHHLRIHSLYKTNTLLWAGRPVIHSTRMVFKTRPWTRVDLLSLRIELVWVWDWEPFHWDSLGFLTFQGHPLTLTPFWERKAAQNQSKQAAYFTHLSWSKALSIISHLCLKDDRNGNSILQLF